MTGSRWRPPALLMVASLALAAGSCSDSPPEGSMAAGSHAALDCGDCHPGANGTGVVPAAAEASCAMCHESADLAGQVTVQNVTLMHMTHPGLDTGSVLGCAACHSHDTGEADLAMMTSSCFLCHAELPAATSGLAAATIPETACAACHVQPSHTTFAVSGAPIDHATVLAQGVSCLLCHFDVAAGTGSAPPSTCRDCHGREGGPGPIGGRDSIGADSVHAYHFADTLAMGCGRCHDPVDHEVIKLASSLVLDCAGCHSADDPALQSPIDSAAHNAAQQLYTGLDPHHADAVPAAKFIERVSCTSCHSPGVRTAPAGSQARLRALNAECVACHGSRFDGLLDPWVAGMRVNTGNVGEYVRAAAANAAVRRSARADSLARAGLDIWQHVDDAVGVHNLPAADALLRDALAAARSAFIAVGVQAPTVPRLGPDPEAVSCMRCHYGVQSLQRSVFGQTFGHDEHVIAGNIACAECHTAQDLFEEDGRTFDPRHGVTDVALAECATCHHIDRAGDCLACHSSAEIAAVPLQADIAVHVQRDDSTRSRSVGFSHTAHGSLVCGDCHQAGNPAQTAASCADCHESHHTESVTAGCSACHGSATRALHQRTDHLVCGACHAPATLSLLGPANRRFCVQCHVDHVDHRPEDECSTCHLLLSPEEAMRQILSARTPPRDR